ncbi:cobalamine biosynthesis protein [Vibrio cholerae]|nr:cobalamine biosynthesis protein [Vibrio cholerae]
MTTQPTSVLNDIVAVQLHVSQWTGRKKLADTDLSLNGEIPPKEIINLGSKHTTDPEALKVFNTIKRRMERACLTVGIPFLGGYAVPANKADELAKLLTRETAQYAMEKMAYLHRHEAIQKDWIKKFPDYEKILIQALTPKVDVEKRISANFSMFKVQSAQASVSVDSGLGNQVESLGQTLDADILKSAQKLLDSLAGAIQPNQTNVSSLRKLREKVEGLAFLNNRFSQLVNKIKKVESEMPIVGKLTTDEVNKLSGLLFRMSDENKLQALMQNLEQEPTATNVQTPQVNEQPEKNDPIDLSETQFDIQEDDLLGLGEANFDIDDIYESDLMLDKVDFNIDESLTLSDAVKAQSPTFFF